MPETEKKKVSFSEDFKGFLDHFDSISLEERKEKFPLRKIVKRFPEFGDVKTVNWFLQRFYFEPAMKERSSLVGVIPPEWGLPNISFREGLPSGAGRTPRTSPFGSAPEPELIPGRTITEEEAQAEHEQFLGGLRARREASTGESIALPIEQGLQAGLGLPTIRRAGGYLAGKVGLDLGDPRLPIGTMARGLPERAKEYGLTSKEYIDAVSSPGVKFVTEMASMLIPWTLATKIVAPIKALRSFRIASPLVGRMATTGVELTAVGAYLQTPEPGETVTDWLEHRGVDFAIGAGFGIFMRGRFANDIPLWTEATRLKQAKQLKKTIETTFDKAYGFGIEKKPLAFYREKVADSDFMGYINQIGGYNDPQHVYRSLIKHEAKGELGLGLWGKEAVPVYEDVPRFLRDFISKDIYAGMPASVKKALLQGKYDWNYITNLSGQLDQTAVKKATEVGATSGIPWYSESSAQYQKLKESLAEQAPSIVRRRELLQKAAPKESFMQEGAEGPISEARLSGEAIDRELTLLQRTTTGPVAKEGLRAKMLAARRREFLPADVTQGRRFRSLGAARATNWTKAGYAPDEYTARYYEVNPERPGFIREKMFDKRIATKLVFDPDSKLIGAVGEGEYHGHATRRMKIPFDSPGEVRIMVDPERNIMASRALLLDKAESFNQQYKAFEILGKKHPGLKWYFDYPVEYPGSEGLIGANVDRIPKSKIWTVDEAASRFVLGMTGWKGSLKVPSSALKKFSSKPMSDFLGNMQTQLPEGLILKVRRPQLGHWAETFEPSFMAEVNGSYELARGYASKVAQMSNQDAVLMAELVQGNKRLFAFDLPKTLTDKQIQKLTSVLNEHGIMGSSIDLSSGRLTLIDVYGEIAPEMETIAKRFQLKFTEYGIKRAEVVDGGLFNEYIKNWEVAYYGGKGTQPIRRVGAEGHLGGTTPISREGRRNLLPAEEEEGILSAAEAARLPQERRIKLGTGKPFSPY